MTVTFTAPPNHRASQSCGTCTHWTWGYEGEGNCGKFPATVTGGGTSHTIYEGEYSTMMCDAWEAPAPAAGA
jgi:hypothetical protein